jgi:hypothetical protein
MIQVTAGHLQKMQAQEAKLMAEGYKKVGPNAKVRPMEYSKTDDYAGEQGSSFTLTWNDPYFHGVD